MTTLLNDPVSRSEAYFGGGWHATPNTFEVIHPGTLESEIKTAYA